MSELFRKEAIDKQASKHLGDVFLASPLSFWVITGLLAVIIAGVIVLAVFGEYARKERVTGVLAPSDGLVQIYPTRAGNFGQILVGIGDEVQPGTILVKLKEEIALTGGGGFNDALLTELETEKRNLESQLNQLPDEYALRRNRLRQQKTETSAEAARFDPRIDVQQRAVDLEEGLFRKMQSLMAAEAASALEVASQENRYLSATQTLQALENDRANIYAGLTDIDAQLGLLPSQLSQAELDLKNRISVIDQKMIRNDVDTSSVIRAPIAGTVAAVTARQGQQASSGKTAMTLLPEGGRLQAELFVPTRAIGFIKEGQTVRLLYDAFPYQKFGFHKGTVIEVSKSVVQKSDLTNAPGITDPVFLVRVDLDAQSVLASGETIPLQSGMSLSADLILEERKIWEWAFDPLLGAIR